MLTQYLEKIFTKKDFTPHELNDIFQILADGKANDIQIGAFLAMLRLRGEKMQELVYLARNLKQSATFINCGKNVVVDIVGTGGDCSNSFNISTTSAIVAAGAGVCIAKHGNRSVSSKCGSADVLAELGYNLDASPTLIEYMISEFDIGFLFAPKLHPVMAKMAPIRRSLKIRTIFNMLGPLCNPASANAMILGVYSANLTELYAHALHELGVRNALVVHGIEGIDEISCCGITRVSELKDGEVSSYEILPEMFLDKRYDFADLIGGEAPENAEILKSVIFGINRGACRAAVLINAGAAIYVSGLAKDLREGIKLASESIDSGKAAEKLRIMLEVSNGKCN